MLKFEMVQHTHTRIALACLLDLAWTVLSLIILLMSASTWQPHQARQPRLPRQPPVTQDNISNSKYALNGSFANRSNKFFDDFFRPFKLLSLSKAE